MKRICAVECLTDPGSFGFRVETASGAIDGFIVLRNGEFSAWRNRCPHTGGPLDWVEHQFLDIDNAFIQCATHDARFRIADGVCVSGPCPGLRLQALPIRVDGGAIYLVEAEIASPNRS